MQINRRSLFLGTAACAGSVLLPAVQAATASESPDTLKAPASKPHKTEEWDVVVLGSGIAGLCAALQAKESGAKVVLLEKMARPDSTTSYSSGWIAGTKTKLQDKDDPDTKEQFFQDLMEVSGGRSDPALMRVYADTAGDGINWLIDHGMKFKIWPLPKPDYNRCHIVPPGEGTSGGAEIVKTLLAALKKAEVPIRYNTKAVELIHDDCFNVHGVSCITGDHRTDFLTKGGVIMCTGGFAGNNAMVDAFISPGASRMVIRGAPWATGENVIMANQVMGKLVNMDQFYAGPITPTGHCNPSPLMHAGYGIQLISEGKRFVPEHYGQVPKASGIADLPPDNMSYLLIGQDADANANMLSDTLDRFKRLGYDVVQADTIEEAVKKAGLPVKQVMATVKEFNDAIKAGKGPELNPPYLFEDPHPLETGPFYLVPAAGGIANTFGGPKIDDHARVVNFENKPIPGLYAAGAAAGGCWYYVDIDGSQLGGGMVFGRIAAKDAAARAKKNS